MASMFLMDKKDLTYKDYARLASLPLDELAAQCDVQVFRATGPGGQGVNTTDSAVRMVHRPTGEVVVSRESRSQYRNRQLCLQKICAKGSPAAPCRPRCATRPSRAGPPGRGAWTRSIGARRSSSSAAAIPAATGTSRNEFGVGYQINLVSDPKLR